MSLDPRGRLVANREDVFNNKQIIEEIEAAKILSKALARLRSTRGDAPGKPPGDEG
jgi:hypothetical protein